MEGTLIGRRCSCWKIIQMKSLEDNSDEVFGCCCWKGIEKDDDWKDPDVVAERGSEGTSLLEGDWKGHRCWKGIGRDGDWNGKIQMGIRRDSDWKGWIRMLVLIVPINVVVDCSD